MNNLTLLLLGLVLVYTSASLSLNNDKQCFSQSLKPSYPCCKGNKVVYTDESGDWGVENNAWCGIGGISCFSLAYGYPCCKGNKVVYTDEDGDWGVENNAWCGIGGISCFSLAYGYPCCKGNKVVYTDESGDWGVENNVWCGIGGSNSTLEINDPVQNDSSNPNFEFLFLKMENNKKNMLYSPLSIQYALKMLQEGANNNTLAEINKVVGNRELPKYTSIDKNLSLANGLFIRDIFYEDIITEYINTLKEKYDAEVVQDEFKNAQKINKWIEDKTLGIIKSMISNELIQDPDLKMLLVNAIAIDMQWDYKFQKKKTYEETFYKDGQEIQVEMMFNNKVLSSSVAYYIDKDLTVLTMNLKDYDGIQFEFMAIMPNENLSAYVENVTKKQINEIDEKLILSTDVVGGINVKIPKFKFNYDLNLKQDLKNSGINEAFNKYHADFSKIADITNPETKLYVSDTLHKADIEFSEDGLKAAAVTVITSKTLSAPSSEEGLIDVVINKPFMFIIRDKMTKDIWFTGTVYLPELW